MSLGKSELIQQGERAEPQVAAEHKPHVLAYAFMHILHACSITSDEVFSYILK